MPKTVTLRPRSGGRYLDLNEVIRGVKTACAYSASAYVETSSEGAPEKALECLNQPSFNQDLAQREQIAKAALFVHFGDDLASGCALLSMLLMPGQPLLIEYSPQAPSDAMPALITRCARVLGYDVVVQPDTKESVAPPPQHSAPRAGSVWEACAKFVAKFITWMRPQE